MFLIDLPDSWWGLLAFMAVWLLPILIAVLRRAQHWWAVLALSVGVFLVNWLWLVALFLSVVDRRMDVRTLRPADHTPSQQEPRD